VNESESGWDTFVLTIALSAAVTAAAIWSHQPQMRGDAGPNVFSAVRAREVLRRLVGDGAPHPVGTPANDAVRARVIAEFARLGYEPTTQEAFLCGKGGACARVKNVLARMPGTGGSKSVLLSAHYDSVPAGPGASDDGMGVAVMLEVARILRRESPRRNPVVFLIDDGEEAGLIGAQAFVQEHSWAREVGAVVNLEARGTTGPSFLFETSDDNRWLIELAARALPRPDTSSLFYTIYKWLPNDTDLTVFRRAGLSGVNFAHIGDVERYHTPLDTFANASPATIGEHGAHVLAMARALAEADLVAPHRGNSVFFDVFAKGIVWWRQESTGPLAAAAAMLVAAAVGRALARGALRMRDVLRGLPAGLLAFVAPVGGALAAIALARGAGAVPTSWVAHPIPILIAVWALSCAGAWLPAALFGRPSGWRSVWAAIWILWAAAGVALSLTEPALAFLAIIPSAVAGAAGLVALANGRPAAAALAVALPATAQAFFWLPIAWLLYGALGARSAAIGASVGMWAAAAAPGFLLLPAAAGRRLLLTSVAAAILAIAAAVFFVPHDAAVPERMQIVAEEDSDTGAAQWLILPESGRLSERLRAAGFVAAPGIEPWSPLRGFAAAAPRGFLPPPRFLIREIARAGMGRRVTATLVSDRGAPVVFLAFPPRMPISAIAINGRPVSVDSRLTSLRGGWTLVSCLTTPPQGVEVAFTAGGGAPLEVFAGDRSYGLPPGSQRIVALRGDSAVTSQSGDLTDVIARLKI
jgi:peptidase M28-like protein